MNDKEFSDLKSMVERIYTAIVGDKDAGITGLAHKVDRHERQISALNKIVWMLAGAAMLVGIISKYLL